MSESTDLRFHEVLFGILSFISILASILAIAVSKKDAATSTSKLPSIRKTQIGVFLSLAFYHCFLAAFIYCDMILWDRKVSNWERDNKSVWIQLFMFLFLDSFLICSTSWLLSFWSKLINVHYLTSMDQVLKRLIANERLYRSMIIFVAVEIILHPIAIAVAFGDGVRIMMFFDIIEIICLVPLFIINIPLLIDLAVILIRTESSPKTRPMRFSIIRLMIVSVFAILTTMSALLTAVLYVFSTPDRLGRNYGLDEGSNGKLFVSPRVSYDRFAFSCVGLIVSLPFIISNSGKLRLVFKETTQKTRNSTTK